MKHDFLANGRKIQVKMAWRNKGAYLVSLVKRRRKVDRVVVKRYKEGDFDFLAVFNEDERDFWIIPAEEAFSRSEIRLWVSPVQFNHGFDSSIYWQRWDLLGV
jgi:hypothetical protein